MQKKRSDVRPSSVCALSDSKTIHQRGMVVEAIDRRVGVVEAIDRGVGGERVGEWEDKGGVTKRK